jgi:hypothetical protein
MGTSPKIIQQGINEIKGHPRTFWTTQDNNQRYSKFGQKSKPK